MYLGFKEEGDRCPQKGCKGVLGFHVEGCSCHINPPCGACVSTQLSCGSCGWEDDAPESKDLMAAPGLSMREYRPRKLDNTKISYRSKMHTNSSMLKEGVYPEGTTAEEVAKVVRGTFGGRFTNFGNGLFKYIAYTD